MIFATNEVRVSITMTWLRLFYCRCHRVSQRQSHSDDDYSEGDELD